MALETGACRPQFRSMSTHSPSTVPARLHDLAAMASLLERLENGPRDGARASAASAEQYRDVVRRIDDLLGQAEPGAAFDALLAVAPATAALYENRQYAFAGLCRSPLEPALEAELAASAAIAKARRRVG